jgi:4-hydroxy-tetrahydrodipicolinate synthase
LGSSGEFTALSPEDRLDVIRIVVDEVKGQVPILAGASDSGTKRVIRLVHAAREGGADVAVVLPPYYLGCTEAELLRHYQAILDETDMPILLYNNPASTRVRITLNTLKALTEHERVVGIKDSSGDFAYFRQAIYAYRDHPRFRVVQGHEGYAGVSFLLGAHAGHLGLANVAPRLFVELYEAAQDGKVEEVLRLQNEVDSLASMWEIGGGTEASYFNSMKTALWLFGVCGLGVSRPYAPFGDAEVAQVRNIMQAHGLLPA